jgi:hypothetical protein
MKPKIEKLVKLKSRRWALVQISVNSESVNGFSYGIVLWFAQADSLNET